MDTNVTHTHTHIISLVFSHVASLNRLHKHRTRRDGSFLLFKIIHLLLIRNIHERNCSTHEQKILRWFAWFLLPDCETKCGAYEG